MGWQKWDYDVPGMMPQGGTYKEGGRTALDIMEPGHNNMKKYALSTWFSHSLAGKKDRVHQKPAVHTLHRFFDAVGCSKRTGAGKWILPSIF